MEYEVDDLILPKLALPRPCPISIIVDDKGVRLFVGPRDWQWDKKTGKFVGCGTTLCQPTLESCAKKD